MDPSSDASDFWIFSKQNELLRKEDDILAPEPYADVYNMNHQKKGVAVIFNHVHYANPAINTREGSNCDRNALQDLFTELRFDVKTFNDLKVSEIDEVLKTVSKMDHTECDCLIIVMMTHGDNGILLAQDGTFPTSNLWNIFSADKCPSLAGKPKLFFIQACRGKGIDPGVELKSKREKIDEVDFPKTNEMYYTIPIMADILIMYSTTEGYYSWRDPKSGTYFIQSLISQMKKYIDKDLLTILTFVNRQVAIGFVSDEAKTEYSGNKQMCSIVSMLTRLVYFNYK